MSDGWRFPTWAKVSLAVGIIALDIVLLPPVVRFLFGGSPPGFVAVREASDLTAEVQLFAVAPHSEVQILLKPCRDSARQNEFNDRVLNQQILGLDEIEHRFWTLHLVNFSAGEAVRLDLGESPLRFSISGGDGSLKGVAGEDVASTRSSRSSEASLLPLQSAGRRRVDVPPRSAASILVAFPAKEWPGFDRLDQAVLERWGGEGDLVLAKRVANKAELDDFLLYPQEPLELHAIGGDLAIRSSPPEGVSDSASPPREYGPR